MKKTIILAALLLFAGAALNAQNLDPTVVVTNTYAQQAGAVEKPSQLLAVPDSVMRFNLDFDYSALSVPYKGAYEFKPYLVELRPTARPSGEGNLYVNLGVGYSFHPELAAVWTPVRKDNLRLNVYADHHSYAGFYRGVGFYNGMVSDDGTFYRGADMRTLAGVDGLFTWNGGRIEANLNYRNIYGSDRISTKNSFNAIDFNVRLESNPDASLYYIVKNSESFTWLPVDGEEVHSVTSAGIGTHFGNHYLRVGILADIVSASERTAGNVAITPRYIFSVKDFNFDLGAKVSFLFRSNSLAYPLANYPWSFVFPVFPDVRINYCVVPDKLALYASATGGHVMNTYSALAEKNHFLASFAGNMDASVEIVNAALGARGNVSERFYFNIKAGYTFRANSLLWGLDAAGKTPLFGYAPKYHMFYSDFVAGWKGDRIDIDSHLLLQKTSLNEQNLFAPALLQGTAKVVYNWGDRIHAGVTFDGQTEKTCALAMIPGYVDLGLMGDIQMNRYLGFWLKVGNLLNQSVQRVPFHAERGIYFTVGARLNL